MSEETFYLLTLFSIFVSPLIFMMAKKEILSYVNWGLIVLFFFSWYWALHYKLTPEKLYLGEVAFFIMVILVTAIVWVSFWYLLKSIIIISNVKLIISFLLLGLFTVVVNILYEEFPVNIDVFYARFHIYFSVLLTLSCFISSWFSRKKDV